MSCFQSFDTGVEVSSSNGLWTVAGHQGREGRGGCAGRIKQVGFSTVTPGGGRVWEGGEGGFNMH